MQTILQACDKFVISSDKTVKEAKRKKKQTYFKQEVMVIIMRRVTLLDT